VILIPNSNAHLPEVFKNGDRNGIGAQLMKKAVAQLSQDEMLAIAAYVSSQP